MQYRNRCRYTVPKFHRHQSSTVKCIHTYFYWQKYNQVCLHRQVTRTKTRYWTSCRYCYGSEGGVWMKRFLKWSKINANHRGSDIIEQYEFNWLSRKATKAALYKIQYIYNLLEISEFRSDLRAPQLYTKRKMMQCSLLELAQVTHTHDTKSWRSPAYITVLVVFHGGSKTRQETPHKSQVQGWLTVRRRRSWIHWLARHTLTVPRVSVSTSRSAALAVWLSNFRNGWLRRLSSWVY